MLQVGPFSTVVTNRLQELGYTNGRNLRLDVSDAPLAGLPAVAAEFVGRAPNVFVAGGSEFVLDIVKRAAGATPIVMLFVDFDPVATGHVVSCPGPEATSPAFTCSNTASPPSVSSC